MHLAGYEVGWLWAPREAILPLVGQGAARIATLTKSGRGQA